MRETVPFSLSTFIHLASIWEAIITVTQGKKAHIIFCYSPKNNLRSTQNKPLFFEILQGIQSPHLPITRQHYKHHTSWTNMEKSFRTLSIWMNFNWSIKFSSSLHFRQNHCYLMSAKRKKLLYSKNPMCKLYFDHNTPQFNFSQALNPE